MLAAGPSEQTAEAAAAKHLVAEAWAGKVEGLRDGKTVIFKGIP
jgi:hypothetical protein